MQIISKKKKKRIGARLGFLWFYMKSLSPADFDIATKLLCELCLDLEIPWEVVHARWEDMYGGKYANPRYRCSHCKEKANYKIERDMLSSWHEVQALTPICHNCGARMDGENK